MPQLVDLSLVNAYQSALAPLRQSRRDLLESIGGAVGDVGESLVRRRGEMQDTRRNLRDYEQALKIESAGLEDERSKLMDFIAKGPPSEREQAVADAQLRSIDKRLGEIGRVGETVPQNIGESVTYRNFRDVRPAILGKREDYTPDAALQSISAREQSEAMAAKEAQRQQERDQDFARQLQLAQVKARPDRDVFEETAMREEAKLQVQEKKAQDSAKKAHSQIESTLVDLESLIDKYGDSLFGAETLMGGASEVGGRLIGTEMAGARKQFDNLANALVEKAIEARKGTGTISDKDLEVIMQGVISRDAPNAATAKKIIENIRKKSAAKVGSQNEAPELLRRPSFDNMSVEELLQMGGEIIEE